MGKQTFTVPLYERDIQAELGLAMPDPVETRKTVYQFFDAYRICKRLLDRDIVEHIHIEAVRGYANAMNPDDVRVTMVHASGPKGFSDPLSDEDLMSSREREWYVFVKKMDKRVGNLRPEQRDLIRHRFLDNDPPPSDDQTYMHWYNQGWTHSFRTFERVKREAVYIVAAGLNASY